MSHKKNNEPTKQQQNSIEGNNQSNQLPSQNPCSDPTSPILLRIHVDDQNKKKICLFWTLLVIIASLIAILSVFVVPNLYMPQEKVLYSTDVANCKFPNSPVSKDSLLTCDSYYNTSQIGETMVGWGAENQFALIYLQIIPLSLVDSFTFTTDLNISIYNLQPYYNEELKKNIIGVQEPISVTSQVFKFDSSSAKPLYSQEDDQKIGYNVQLAIITYLNNNPMFISVKFNQTLNNSLINTMKLQSYAVNYKFTYYTIIVRYVFFGLSLCSLILYFIRYLKIPKNQRIFEQVLVGIASILLLMFNDPFYPITVLKPNGGSVFFSILFVVNLIVFLFFTWIVTADRIHQQDGKVGTEQITKKKIAYTVVIWLQLFVVMMVYSMQQINTTPILAENLQATYIAAKVIIILSFLASIIYVFVRYFQVWRSQEPKLWRSKVFMVISSAFIVLIFSIVVGNQLIPYNYSGSTILLAYGLVNLYVYYLQYMFTITKKEAQNLEREKTKKQGKVDVNMEKFNMLDVNRKDQTNVVPEGQQNTSVTEIQINEVQRRCIQEVKKLEFIRQE